MFENPRRGRRARNFTINVPKILDLKSSSEQIFLRKLSLGAPALCDLLRRQSSVAETKTFTKILHYTREAICLCEGWPLFFLANTAVGFPVGLVWAFHWYNWPPLAVFFFSSSLQRNYIPQNHPSSELSPQSSLPSQTSHMYIQNPLWHLYSYELQFEGWVQGVVDWVGLVVSVTETWWNVLS